MLNTKAYCQVHRFHEYIAVYIGGKTVYMTPSEAMKFAEGLFSHIHDAQVNPFGKSSLPTFSMDVEEKE